MTGARPVSSHTAAGITVAAVVDAALAVIADRGVSGLTMRVLAERLGVRAPTLYHHVGTKDELLVLVARGTFATFADDRDAYDEVRTLQQWLDLTADGSRRLRAFYTRHPGLAAVILRTATADRADGDDARAALVQAQVDALVRLGVPAAEAGRTFETCARWTLAAVAAESVVADGDPVRHAEIFDRGLRWLLEGVRADLGPR